MVMARLARPSRVTIAQSFEPAFRNRQFRGERSIEPAICRYSDVHMAQRAFTLRAARGMTATTHPSIFSFSAACGAK